MRGPCDHQSARFERQRAIVGFGERREQQREDQRRQCAGARRQRSGDPHAARALRFAQPARLLAEPVGRVERRDQQERRAERPAAGDRGLEEAMRIEAAGEGQRRGRDDRQAASLATAPTADPDCESVPPHGAATRGAVAEHALQHEEQHPDRQRPRPGRARTPRPAPSRQRQDDRDDIEHRGLRPATGAAAPARSAPAPRRRW